MYSARICQSGKRLKSLVYILIIKANEMHDFSNLFDKLWISFAFIIRIYQDARSSECQSLVYVDLYSVIFLGYDTWVNIQQFVNFRKNTGIALVRTKKQFYELLFILGTEVINLKILVVTQQTLYRVIHKSVKHFKISQQINYSTDHGSSYADRERNSPNFGFMM